MIDKDLLETVQARNGLEFVHRQLTVGDLRRQQSVAKGLPFPRSYYIVAYDAFKRCVEGYSSALDTIPAGVVLGVGIQILEKSGFFKTIVGTNKDLEEQRTIAKTYFENVRTLACFHFGYKLEETEGWSYTQLLNMAARLETVLNIDLGMVDRKKQEELEKKRELSEAQQVVSSKEGDRTAGIKRDMDSSTFSIKKGDIVPTSIIRSHNANSAGYPPQ